METALPRSALLPASEDGLLVFLLQFWARLGRQKTRSATTTHIDEQHQFVLAAIHRFGSLLLAAEDADDLAARIDQILDEEDFHGAIVRMTDSAIQGLRAAKASIAEDTTDAFALGDSQVQAELIRILGPATEELIIQGLRHMQAIGRVWPVFVRQHMPDGLPGPLEEVQEMVSRIAYDPNIPPAVARGIVSGQRMNAMFFAMLEALIRDFYLEPWLGLALAECFLHSAHGYLRLLASGTPEVEVPEDLLSREERLPMSILRAESQLARDDFKRLVEQAEHSGEPLYPSDK